MEFTSLSPFRVKVSGRLKHFINHFWEYVIIYNTDRAIALASEPTSDAVVNDYTAAPVYFSDQGNGAHEWVIEFEKEPADMDAFTTANSTPPCNEINSDYEAKRHKDIALSKPIVHSCPNGLFNNWLKGKGKLGGQHKVPRLSNDRRHMEEILDLLIAGVER